MATRRTKALRDWLFTLVGLVGICVILARPDPNPISIVALASLAGRPVYSGLADIVQIRRRDADDEREPDAKKR